MSSSSTAAIASRSMTCSNGCAVVLLLALLFPVLVAVGLPVAVGELGDSLLAVVVPGESGDKGNEDEYYGHNIILVFGVNWIDIA